VTAVDARTSVHDTLGRGLSDLRISVTDRCNFRCGYCMPREVFHDHYRFLPRRDLLSYEEIARVARIAVSVLGVRKLRVTGGEPLVRRDLPELIAMLAAIPGVADIALTTNGLLLAEQAAPLARAGLKRVTVSLDALDATTFQRMSGTSIDPARVLDGIAAADAAGLRPIKINCVVIRGQNEHAIRDLVRRFRGTPHVVRFIEYMDVGTINGWKAEDVLSADEIVARIDAVARCAPVPLADGRGVAERYRFVDGSGEVGVIASITRPFCGQCERARLTAEGRVLGCLFAGSGLDLRALLRTATSDDAIAAELSAFWRRRSDRYSEERAASTDALPKRRLEMYQVGG
jgi:cyclic pyranopterin phosphate synthase